MSPRAILITLSVVLVWGFNFSLIKIGLREWPPFFFSALRFGLIAIPAVFFVPFPKGAFWHVLGGGLFFGIIKFSMMFIAIKGYSSAGLASLILQVQAPFTILLSLLLFKEKITLQQFIGMGIAVIGFSFFFLEEKGNITTIGIILLVGAGLFWAITNVIIKDLKEINLLHYMVWLSVIPPLPLLAMSYYFESQDPIGLVVNSTWPTWVALIFASYFSTLFGFAIWGRLLKTYSAASVTPFSLLIPIVGLASTAFFLDEKMSSLEIIGAAIVLLGLAFCVMGRRLMRFFGVNV